MGVLFALPNVHQCADFVNRVSLAEPVLSSSRSLGVVVTITILHALFSIVGIVWLRKSQFSSRTRVSDKHSPLLESTAEMTRVRPANDPDASGSLEGDHHFLQVDSISSDVSSFPKRARNPLLIFALLGVLLLFVPATLQLFLNSIPDDNSIGVSDSAIPIYNGALLAYLVLIDTITPNLVKALVSAYYGGPRRISTNLKSRRRYYHTTLLVLVLQGFFLLVIWPIAFQLTTHQHCFRAALQLWRPCSPSQTEFSLETRQLVNLYVGGQVVLSREQVCDTGGKLNTPDMCIRGVISTTSQLVMSEVMVKPVLHCLKMTIKGIWSKCLCKYFEKYLKCFVRHLKSGFGWCCICCGSKSNRASRKPSKRNFFHWLLLSSPTENDTTREVFKLLLLGLVYGAVAPLVWVCVVLSIACTIDSWISIACRPVPLQSEHPVPNAIVWSGLLFQLLFVFMYFLADQT
eukprot:c20802_g1_i1.p1 GENE.c20802_g1_i1~~c20802_g1_i1.p1  ORF type:complete len:489 (+),score=50.19 c20802_g1_i1:90-1469(+)